MGERKPLPHKRTGQLQPRLIIFERLCQYSPPLEYQRGLNMEADRAAVDLGIAADLEQAQAEEEEVTPAPIQRQPKKRFVGRRQATESAAAGNDDNSAIENSSAVQGTLMIVVTGLERLLS